MPKNEAVPAAPMRILKINTCSSLSGRSQLTYHLGCNADGDIHFRIVQNTGSGQFNADWIPLPMIEQLLSGHPKEKPLTSSALHPVYRGKSSNSPAFMFSGILAEGLVKPSGNKGGVYAIGDIEAFKQAMSALIASGTNLETAAVVAPEVPKRKRKEA